MDEVWPVMKQLGLVLGAPVLLLVLSGTYCRDARDPREKQPAAARKQDPVKISQFYAAPPAVERGGQALLCYGVENARAVRLAPDVEPIRPAFSRCVPVTPVRTTTYTFTAEGEDGSTASKSVTLEVVKGAAVSAAAQAPSAAGPQISYFRSEPKPDLTLLCYLVQNADAVEITPNVLPRGRVFTGCVGVPNGAATYTLTAFAGGKRIQKTLSTGSE
jgi:hypothetical protein